MLRFDWDVRKASKQKLSVSISAEVCCAVLCCAVLCCGVLCPHRLGIEEPTWEELYGNGGGEEGHPFDDYFCKPGDDDDFMGQGAIGEVRG